MWFFGEKKYENFSPDEISLLFLTNDGDGPLPNNFSRDKTLVLTTKETYIWGIIISKIVQEKPEIGEQDVIIAYRNAVRKNKEHLLSYYSNLPEKRYRYREPFGDSNFEIFYLIVKEMQKELKIEFNYSELYDSEQKAFNSLLNQNLIKDPIFTSILGFSTAIIGFIPYGFTQKTRRGRTVSRKIEALFWSYQRTESRGEVTTKVNFRLWKIITAFKKALAEVSDDEINK